MISKRGRAKIKGKRFGRLTVIKSMGSNIDKKQVWLCKCDCGKTTQVTTNALNRGNTKSCGCLAISSLHERNKRMLISKGIYDLSGGRFGKLTVIRVNGNKGRSRLWLCECDCGEITNVVTVRLRNGHTKSCGCSMFGNRKIDITGNRFGRLIATQSRKSDSTKHKQRIWLCRCDCGRNIEVLTHYLISGDVKSCGCLRIPYLEDMDGSHMDFKDFKKNLIEALTDASYRDQLRR
jgi:hypothetical protein